MFPLRSREISLLSEPSFQLIGLRFGKEDAAFFLFADVVVVGGVGGGTVAAAIIVGSGGVTLRSAGR